MKTRRRTAAIIAIALLTTARFALPAHASTEPAFVLGSGAASAGVTKARLFYAGYSLALPFGLAATQYENKQSRALGSAFDIKAALDLVDVKNPQLSPNSIDSNAGDKRLDVDSGAGPNAGHVQLSARAVPSAQSEVHLADLDLTGIARISGGHTASTTEIVNGNERVAEANATIASLSVAGGLVELDGLHWTAVHHTGATKAATVSFSVDRLLVGGVPVATDLTAANPIFDAVNLALAPTGLVINPPAVIPHTNGAVEIGGLRVGIINSPLGSQYLGPLIAQLRPQLLPIFEALTKANDDLGLAGLVSDLGLGVADGSGGVDLTIGGATAITDDRVFDNPFAGADLGGVTLTPAPAATSILNPVPGAPGSIGSPGTQKVISTSAAPARCVLADNAGRKGDCRGVNVAGAIGIVLFVVAGLAAYEAVARRRRDAKAVAS